MIKQDSDNIEGDKFTASLKTDQTQALHNILHFIYDDSKVNAYERFNASQMTANWKPTLVTKGQAIQSALEKLQAANDALAKKEDASLRTLAQQAYTQAKQALSTSTPNTPAPAK
jgi:protein subunit release factor A